jgi:hypothetical protein
MRLLETALAAHPQTHQQNCNLLPSQQQSPTAVASLGVALAAAAASA